MIGEIQKQVLASYLTKIATDRGVTIHPLLMNEVLNQIYSSSNRQPGEPFTFPLRQTPRSEFDVAGFNKFFDQLQLDTDTLFKLTIRARIEARRLLMLNDVRMRSFQDRVKSITLDATNFNTRSVTPEGIYEATFSLPINFCDYYFKDQTHPLEVDSQNNVITLPVDTINTSIVDLTYLATNPSAITVSSQVSISELLVDESTVPISNIALVNATPWIHNISTNTQANEVSIVVTITLPSITELNRIDLDNVPGGLTRAAFEVALVADNYLPLGIIKADAAKYLVFTTQKVSKIRMTLTNTPYQATTKRSDFMFGIRSLQLSRNAYKSTGEVIITDIDPNIAGKTIISAALQAIGNTPDGSSVDYGLRFRGAGHFTEVAGQSLGDTVQFNIAQILESGLARVGKSDFTLCPERNKISFKNIVPLDRSGNSLIPTGVSILDRYIDIRPAQNCFKKIANPSYTTLEIQDALVAWGAGNENVPIRAPLVLTGQPLRSGTNQYLQLPVPTAFLTIAPSGGIGTPLDQMKLGQYGIYKVEAYLTTSPDTLTDITSSCSITEADKIVVTGTFTQKYNFKVQYLAQIDSSVYIKPETLLLHRKTGVEGVKDENVINYSRNLYHLDSHANKVYATQPATGSTNLLVNNTEYTYLNFTGIFLTPKIELYETYVTFASDVVGLVLDRPIDADSEYGEYATLRSLQDGNVLRLEKTSRFDSITPGTYLLTVASKPRRVYIGTPPTLMDSLLTVRVDQTSLVPPGASDNEKFPQLFSMTSLQKVISSISVGQDSLKYKTLAGLLNKTPKYDRAFYSTTKMNGNTQIIVPETTDSIFPIPDMVTTALTDEYMMIKFMYFDGIEYNTQDTLDLRIHMENLSNQNSLNTPEITDLKFKIRYI